METIRGLRVVMSFASFRGAGGLLARRRQIPEGKATVSVPWINRVEGLESWAPLQLGNPAIHGSDLQPGVGIPDLQFPASERGCAPHATGNEPTAVRLPLTRGYLARLPRQLQLFLPRTSLPNPHLVPSSGEILAVETPGQGRHQAKVEEGRIAIEHALNFPSEHVPDRNPCHSILVAGLGLFDARQASVVGTPRECELITLIEFAAC